MKRILYSSLFVILISLIINQAFSQTTYYIADVTTNGVGTIGSPYNTWPATLSAGDTYLFKRGDVLSWATTTTIDADNITIGTYDVGVNPKIVCTSTGSIVEITGASGVHIMDLVLEGTVASTPTIGINISGTSGTSESDILIENCVIDVVKTGIFGEYLNNLIIDNCDVTSFYRCIDVENADYITISYSDLLLDFNPNVTIPSDVYGIRIYNGDYFDIKYNYLHNVEPVEGHLFYSDQVVQDNNFYNNNCIATDDMISCVKLGVVTGNIYNNWLEGAQNGILGSDGAYQTCNLHHNVVYNCYANGIHFPETGLSGGYIVKVRHNVVYNSDPLTTYTALNIGPMIDPFSDIWVENNVFYFGKNAGKVYKTDNINMNSRIEYNRIPAEFTNYIEYNGNNISTLAAWQGVGMGGLFGDGTEPYKESNTAADGTCPFVSSTPSSWEDFTPLVTSNCIDDGKVLEYSPSTNFHIDYFGHYIPAGIPIAPQSGVDIGAIEYYPPVETDLANNPPTGWYFANDEIIAADHENYDYPHRKGNIYHDGELVYLRGVNLLAIEFNSFPELSLNTYGIDDILKKIKSLGYNTIRLTYSADIILDYTNTDPGHIPQTLPGYYVNQSLPGNSIFYSSNVTITYYEALKAIVERCGDLNLNVVLANKGIEATSGNEIGLWYNSTVGISEMEYLQSIFYVATNLQYDNVVGISLINEPFEAKWDGSGDVDDFRRFTELAGSNIRVIVPKWLVFVEGVKDHGCADKKAEEATLSEYTSTSEGGSHNSSESYGNAESLSTYGPNSNSSSTEYYPIDDAEIPYHKLVFSPHTTQFEEIYVTDLYHYSDQSPVTEVNEFRWGYLTQNNAVIPGAFGAFYQSENTGVTFVEQAEYAEEWFTDFVEYMAEKKLPGSFYWAFNGNNEGCVTNNTIEYCYEQSLVDPSDWMQEKADKTEDYAIMFGRVDKLITNPTVITELYSPRDGTTYQFSANSLPANSTVKHTAHWAGEDYLTPGNPDYVEYASDVLAAKDNLGDLETILHEFKITCEDQSGTPILTASNDFTITVNYTDNEHGWVDKYFLNFYKYTAGNWVTATGTITQDPENNEISLTTNEFGIYAVLGYGFTRTQQIDLLAGWSMISSFVNPDFPDLDDIFYGLTFCDGNGGVSPCDLVIMKTQAGAVYWPYWGLNGIGDWNYKDGYLLKMETAGSLNLTGVVVKPELTTSAINIPSGWSIIGYNKTTTENIVTMIGSLFDNSYPDEIAKNTAGEVYWPVNNIGYNLDMVPGQGYQLFVHNNTSTFYYPQNTPGTKSCSETCSEQVIAFKNYTQELYINTDNNMVIGIPENSWQTTPQLGDEIAAFGENGQIVGKTIYNGGFTAITIYGDDYYTESITENLAEGESFTFEVWSDEAKTSNSYKFQKWVYGDGTYTNGGIDIVATEKIEEEVSFDVEVFPNPGNGNFYLAINASLKQDAKIDIYDLSGKHVYSKECKLEKGEQIIKLQLSALEVGTYYVNIIGELDSNRTQLMITN